MADAVGAAEKVGDVADDGVQRGQGVGLGGGLAYATQGDFCATLLPRFTSERMFDLVDCEALLSAVELGFETWSANHRFIQFHDMSRDCAGTAPAVVPAGSGVDVPAEEYAAECSRLEISITAGEPLRPGHEKLAAIVNDAILDVGVRGAHGARRVRRAVRARRGATVD